MSQFEQWQDRFATLKPRERGLIWLASSGLLLWLGCVLVLFPMLDQQQQLQGQRPVSQLGVEEHIRTFIAMM